MNEMYVKDIEHDEIRNGFLVTTDRKKIWNKEIELLMEVDRICKKYDIKYFAVDGTLLGAARHKGFIPWDDDIDIAMMRPDYMRFVEAVGQEIKAPLFVQNAHTDNRIINWTKIMDDRTSAIEDWDGDFFHQGIFVDVFPLDSVADGTDRGTLIDEMCRELWTCVIAPHQVVDGLKNGASTCVAGRTLERILDKSLAERMEIYEDFCLKHFEESAKVAFQMAFWCNRVKPVEKTDYKEISYNEFEQVKIPTPAKQDNILSILYGDWRVPKQVPSVHGNIVMSADIPYYVMLNNIDRALLTTVEVPW